MLQIPLIVILSPFAQVRGVLSNYRLNIGFAGACFPLPSFRGNSANSFASESPMRR